MRHLVRVSDRHIINLNNVERIDLGAEGYDTTGASTPAKKSPCIRVYFAVENEENSACFVEFYGANADRFREFLTRMSVSVDTAIQQGDSAGIIDLLRTSHQGP
jgi:hypothetical protein